ncbi:UNVERIFIED_CONTAM: hypothetical protein Sangu_1337400 [Sesamum angustifolium]|uniref:Uncharacterized protein n=1 Tax=Sesamum angustifolium TaxID=2727405 RepID=A0AAW2N545_9LAMI
MPQHFFNTIRSLKMTDGCNGTQVYSVNPTAGGGGGAASGGSGINSSNICKIN